MAVNPDFGTTCPRDYEVFESLLAIRQKVKLEIFYFLGD
jgi:hypothetical protein